MGKTHIPINNEEPPVVKEESLAEKQEKSSTIENDLNILDDLENFDALNY